MKLRLDKELFQWERDRYIFVDMAEEDNFIITYLGFYNAKSQHSHEVKVVNGRAKIPNYLLEDYLSIMAVACVGCAGATRPVGRREFKVIKRTRPCDYGEIDKDDNDDCFDDDDDCIWDGGEESGPVKMIIYDGGEEV